MTMEQPEAGTPHRAAARIAQPGAPAEAAGPAKPDGTPEARGQEKADLTEVKRKFREALERKRGVQAAANAESATPGTGKVHGSHGPAASRRSFRRKSG